MSEKNKDDLQSFAESIDRICFLDLETTGFDENKGAILEVGLIVTRKDLTVIGDHQYVLGISQDELRLMDPTALVMHKKSGLLAESLAQTECEMSRFGWLDADPRRLHYCENRILDRFAELGVSLDAKRTVLAGYSVHFDWRWLRHFMPRVCAVFHHRLLDVSVFNVAGSFWGDTAPREPATHRALDDCKQSLKSMQWYRHHWCMSLPY